MRGRRGQGKAMSTAVSNTNYLSSGYRVVRVRVCEGRLHLYLAPSAICRLLLSLSPARDAEAGDASAVLEYSTLAAFDSSPG